MSYKQQLAKSKTGFTIIEVVLVLAIAGLIFLMVFVALPALQRSQRDTQKREDVSRVASALTQYQSNNNGNLPTAAISSGVNGCNKGSYTSLQSSKTINFRGTYLGGADFKNPQNQPYLLYACIMSGTSFKKPSVDHLDYIFIYTNAKCNKEDPEYSAGDRNYAIITKLEGAGYYCLDNS